jgi:DNA processing protein
VTGIELDRFGVDSATLDRAITAVSLSPGATFDERRERFARAAWTTIAEPGDGIAGTLVGTLGAAHALLALMQAWPREKILNAVAQADQAAGELLDSQLDDALKRFRPRVKSEEALAALEHAARVGARFLTPADACWPSALDDLAVHAPLGLWLRGRPDALVTAQRSLAVVGARAATGYGEHVAMECAAGLVDRGFAIVSGAAYGIDGMAHRATLAAGGTTIAYLAGGVDRFYPSGHDALLRRIVEYGAVLAEAPCGSAPTKWRFLQRNRLIAASSAATVVIEAGHRSGSLNTAGHAAALGRPLGAVPGPVTSPTSAGCHRLIREYDAICVTGAAEMAELVDGPILEELRSDPSSRSTEEIRVLDALSVRRASALHEIASASGLSVATVAAVLGGLHLDGAAVERAGGWMRGRDGDR